MIVEKGWWVLERKKKLGLRPCLGPPTSWKRQLHGFGVIGFFAQRETDRGVFATMYRIRDWVRAWPELIRDIHHGKFFSSSVKTCIKSVLCSKTPQNYGTCESFFFIK